MNHVNSFDKVVDIKCHVSFEWVAKSSPQNASEAPQWPSDVNHTGCIGLLSETTNCNWFPFCRPSGTTLCVPHLDINKQLEIAYIKNQLPSLSLSPSLSPSLPPLLFPRRLSLPLSLPYSLLAASLSLSPSPPTVLSQGHSHSPCYRFMSRWGDWLWVRSKSYVTYNPISHMPDGLLIYTWIVRCVFLRVCTLQL